VHNHLPTVSCLVFNDSKVIPARLLGKRHSGGNVEIFILKALPDGYCFETLIKPLSKLRTDEEICFDGNGLRARVIDKEKKIVRFNKKNLIRYLPKIGHLPLPPYIRRPDQPLDHIYYQTVYAKANGSVAAPTAGLHFTKSLIAKLEKEGHTPAYVTLHVNYATFKPVEAKDIRDHQMHYEDYEVTAKAWATILKAKKQGRKIVGVGTTSTRVIESVAQTQKLLGATNLFVYPGYNFRMIDCLITNFHQPLSTLLMLVYAFGGETLMKHAYQEAIQKKYRFFSYGDAMMIL
ncbi:MAG: tRNA preQ1(34) S-adenosylmethionine ribosyltransferase-isomerase QueA, partial [Candidatus Omnitrophota bacterium]|nr:tRNA preQ1(34) S-adenosylmethionine ribosyltransferase-isomerase QueA [Candidatus Omnitrophota bacterium]